MAGAARDVVWPHHHPGCVIGASSGEVECRLPRSPARWRGKLPRHARGGAEKRDAIHVCDCVRDVGRVQNQHWSVREPTAQSRHRLRLLEAKRKRIRSILDFCSGSGIEEVKPRVAYLGRLRRRRRERGPSVVVPRWLSEPNPTHSDYQGPDQESAAVTKQKCFFNDRRITPSFFFCRRR